MANTAFIRKLVADELYDTLFFVSGQVPVKTKKSASVVLDVPNINVEIFNGRKIHLNGKEHRFSGVVKQDIQRIFAL